MTSASPRLTGHPLMHPDAPLSTHYAVPHVGPLDHCVNTLGMPPTRRDLDRLQWHRPDLHERAVARRRKRKRGGPR